MELLQLDYGNVAKAFYMVHFYGIYGVGAVIIILSSQFFHKNNFTLFLGGYVIGSIIEYFTSLFVELTLHTKWWDYRGNILNLNGRVCLLYSIFWGILTVFLIKKFHPLINTIMEKVATKIPLKLIKTFLACLIIFLMIDCIITCYAQDTFVTRMIIQQDIKTIDRNNREEKYQKLQEKDNLKHFISTFWNDKKMIQTFPNMKIEDMSGNIIYLDSLLPEIQPYYIKIFEK